MVQLRACTLMTMMPTIECQQQLCLSIGESPSPPCFGVQKNIESFAEGVLASRSASPRCPRWPSATRHCCSTFAIVKTIQGVAGGQQQMKHVLSCHVFFKLVVTLIDAGIICVPANASAISGCFACLGSHRRYFAVACTFFQTLRKTAQHLFMLVPLGERQTRFWSAACAWCCCDVLFFRSW